MLGVCRRAPAWPFPSDCHSRGAPRHDLFRPSLESLSPPQEAPEQTWGITPRQATTPGGPHLQLKGLVATDGGKRAVAGVAEGSQCSDGIFFLIHSFAISTAKFSASASVANRSLGTGRSMFRWTLPVDWVTVATAAQLPSCICSVATAMS